MFSNQGGTWGKVRSRVAFIRLKPFDMTTPEGRANERHRRAALTSFSSLLSKAIVVATSLISIPLTVGYLGAERYGMWMTISSVIALLSFADLGMGNSLKNHIAAAYGTDDREKARRLVSSAYAVLMLVALLLAILFAVFYPFISWEKLFNVTSPLAVAEAGPAVAMFVGCFLVNIPLGLIIQIQTGYQEGFVSSLWQSFGNLLALAGVLLVIALKGGLPWLILAMAGTPCLINLLNSAYFFVRQNPWLTPAMHLLDRVASRNILHTGWLFLFGGIVSTVAQSSDNIVVAQLLGAEQVAEFSVSMKLFSILSMVQNAAVTPYWPAYSEAIARGDVPWIRKTLFQTIKVSIAITLPLSLLFVVFGRQVIHLWASKELMPDTLFLAGIATWTVISAVSSSVAMLLSGASVLKEQLVIGIALIAVSLTLKILLGAQFGNAGVMWGGVVAYFCVVVIPYCKIGFGLLRRLERGAGLQSISGTEQRYRRGE